MFRQIIQKVGEHKNKNNFKFEKERNRFWRSSN